MENRGRLLRPGVFQEETQVDGGQGAIEARPATFGLRGLREVAAEYHFFLPHVPHLVYPECPVEPIGLCHQRLGTPTELWAWQGRPVLSLGRFEQLGIPGNLVLGVPKPQWPAIANFVRSLQMWDPRLNRSWVYRIQELAVVDPLDPLSRPIFDAQDTLVPMSAIVVETASAAAHLRPYRHVTGLPKLTLDYRVAINQQLGDLRIAAFVRAFEQAADPHGVVEQQHGRFEIPQHRDGDAAP